MGKLVEEVKIQNTPIIGAYLLWRFTQGYCNAHPTGDAPVGILHFLASGILTNERLSKSISNRRDSLQSYIRSFEENRETDILLSIQERVTEKRKYTLLAIDIAVTFGFLVWDTESGKLYPREITSRPRKGKGLKSKIKKEGDKAEILGKWFSNHDLATIAAYLKVIY